MTSPIASKPIAGRVAEDDAQKLRGQELPAAANLEIDYESDRDNGDAGLSVAGRG